MPPRKPSSPAPNVNAAPPLGGARGLAGLEVGLRLVAGVLLGGGLGYALDVWAGSLPAFMLLGGVLGFGSWLVAVARRR